MRGLIILCSLMVSFILPEFSYSQPFTIPQDSKCSECGMSIDRNSSFVSEAVAMDEKKLFFCDVGDMLFHFRSMQEKVKAVYVRDYSKGEWIDGKKALYILNKKFNTPMSWGIAAFASESEAKKWGSPVDFNGALRLLK